MSDRRTDEPASPLVPHRSLTPPTGPDAPQQDDEAPTAAMPAVDGSPPGPSAPAAALPAPSTHAAPLAAGTGCGAAGEQSAPFREATGPAAAPAGSTSAAAQPRQARRARLRMVRIDPWSVMKMAFALSIALAVVTTIAVAIVWSVLDAAGVWDSINDAVASLVNPGAGEEFDVEEFVGFGRVMGLALVVSAANVVLLTALATLAAFMYNLTSALLGGLELTLAEDR